MKMRFCCSRVTFLLCFLVAKDSLWCSKKVDTESKGGTFSPVPDFFGPAGRQILDRVGNTRRNLRFTEDNAKCRHLKKITIEWTLWQVFICMWPRIPYPPVYTHCP